MKIVFKEENIFIPGFNGNKKLPDSEQIKIYWRYPNSEEVKDIRTRSNPKVVFEGKKISERGMEIEIIINDLLAVKKLVSRIENLEVSGQRILDGEILIKTAGLSGLVTEISTEILGNMDIVRENSKNS
jgi:hypothetical protein